jgi:hypothetical protein
VIFARKTKRAIAVGAVSTGAVTAAVAAYAMGRKHGRAVTLAQIAQREIWPRLP